MTSGLGRPTNKRVPGAGSISVQCNSLGLDIINGSVLLSFSCFGFRILSAGKFCLKNTNTEKMEKSFSIFQLHYDIFFAATSKSMGEVFLIIFLI